MNVLGVMSGTSVDAIDLALARFELDAATGQPREPGAPGGPGATGTLTLTPRGHLELPWPQELRAALLAAGSKPGAGSGAGSAASRGAGDGAAAWCRLHAETGRALAAACRAALRELGPADLVACHGQTVAHRVEEGRVTGTLQVGAPAYIHDATGLPVVADLRTADVAAGGQGAPLASTLDALWLRDVPTAVLNLGGIANVTFVGTADGPLAGDTGPANCLLDAAAAELGLRCDADGALAARGRVDAGALERLLADPYYARPLPKSTGRDYFHDGYVAAVLGPAAPTGPDLFATLVELTARTVADTLARVAQTAGETRVARIVASGGGVDNPVLLGRLRELTGVPVVTSDELGLPAAAKEAYLMALLGWLSVHGLPGVATGPRGPVTGARHAAVLGSLTPPYLTGGLVAALQDPRPFGPPTRLVIAGAGPGPAAGGRSAMRPAAEHGRPANAVDAPPDAPAAAPAAAPDLGWVTERRLPASEAIDTLDTAGIVDVILDADASVAAAVRAAAGDIARAADLLVAALRAGGVVHYVGSGTSGRMGVLDAVELLPTYRVGPESVRAHLAGGADAMVRAAEGAEDDAAGGAALAASFGAADLVVGLAASGRTPYVRGALAAARRRGLATVLVSANPAAPLAALADVAVLPDTGPEVITGSTRMKAATAQKMVLNTMSTAAMVRLGKTYGNLMIEMVPTNAKLRARSVRMLAQGSGRGEAECAAALAAAGGEVRRALVALLAGLAPSQAADARVARALAAAPPDPDRTGDPSGIRAAVAGLGGRPGPGPGPGPGP